MDGFIHERKQRSSDMECSIRLTTEEEKQDQSIPTFDYTKLTALCQCPRWGLIRYDQHKRMPGCSRSMSLEAGSAAHQAFAAIRWFELLESKGLDDQLNSAGLKQFGEERWNTI